jgi:hypothetical protein
LQGDQVLVVRLCDKRVPSIEALGRATGAGDAPDVVVA